MRACRSSPAMERSSKLRRKGAPWERAMRSTTLSSTGSGVLACSRTLGLGSRMGLISRPEHSTYVGRELQKADIALSEGIKFKQDQQLDFRATRKRSR